MEFNDGSAYRWVQDPARHMAEREMFEFRACSAEDGRRKYIDDRFEYHRRVMAPMRALLIYQFPWQTAGTPEEQARFFLDALGGTLRDNEMVMIDTECESDLSNPAEFLHRWCAVVEPALNTKAWVYVPQGPCSLQTKLTRAVTGDRIVKAPRYSGHAGKGTRPSWPHDVWQYTDRGHFPGCSSPGHGDVNVTDWTIERMLTHCRGQKRLRRSGAYVYELPATGGT